MAALQADPVSHVVEELDRRDDPALEKLFYIKVQASMLSLGQAKLDPVGSTVRYEAMTLYCWTAMVGTCIESA